MIGFPFEMRRPLIPNGNRRAIWHDYYSRCIYMITLNASDNMPLFSEIRGEVGSHDFPPIAVNTYLGDIITANISALKNQFPFITIPRRVIMPEHVHFVIFIHEATEFHLGDIITHLKSEITRQYNGLSTVRTSDFENSLISVFEPDYHDRILLKEGQLTRMLNYVSKNPERRLKRMQYPEFFARYALPSFEGGEYEAYGNIFLLDDPDIEAVKVSSKYTAEELRQRKYNWKKTVENCGVLASPFISKAEKKVRDWAIDNGGRFIIMLDNGFGERFTPKGILHQLCAEGRLLLIAPAEHSTSKIKRGKDYWERMNRLAAAISSGKYSISASSSASL